MCFQTSHIAAYLVLKPTESDVIATIFKARELDHGLLNIIELFHEEDRALNPDGDRTWAFC